MEITLVTISAEFINKNLQEVRSDSRKSDTRKINSVGI